MLLTDDELYSFYNYFVEEVASNLQKVSDFQLYSRNELQIELRSLNDIIEFCHRHLAEHEDNRTFSRSGSFASRLKSFYIDIIVYIYNMYYFFKLGKVLYNAELITNDTCTISIYTYRSGTPQVFDTFGIGDLKVR